MKAAQNSLAQRLEQLLADTKGQDSSFQFIIDHLARRGQAALLVLLVLPFCQPIQIPGFSTIFGIALMFIGLRIAFGHRTWIPKALLDRKVPYHILEKIASVAITITDKLRFLTSTRLVFLVQSPTLHIFHGISIAILAFLLALPLPIPFTNLFAAYPILAFGLGLLEDDGIMIIIAYALFFLCLGVFTSLILFGKHLFGAIAF
jgi:hypothetical protein